MAHLLGMEAQMIAPRKTSWSNLYMMASTSYAVVLLMFSEQRNRVELQRLEHRIDCDIRDIPYAKYSLCDDRWTYRNK